MNPNSQEDNLSTTSRFRLRPSLASLVMYAPLNLYVQYSRRRHDLSTVGARFMLGRQIKYYSEPRTPFLFYLQQVLPLLFAFLNYFCATIASTSARTLSMKFFVVFVGFQPNVLALSALQRALLPSQAP